jgi:hypothetical protein
MTTIDPLQYIQPHQLEKCFLKKEKENPPSYIMFQVIF